MHEIKGKLTITAEIGHILQKSTVGIRRNNKIFGVCREIKKFLGLFESFQIKLISKDLSCTCYTYLIVGGWRYKAIQSAVWRWAMPLIMFHQ